MEGSGDVDNVHLSFFGTNNEDNLFAEFLFHTLITCEQNEMSDCCHAFSPRPSGSFSILTSHFRLLRADKSESLFLITFVNWATEESSVNEAQASSQFFRLHH